MPLVTDFELTVFEWAQPTFPDASEQSIIAHMRSELDELEEACKSYDGTHAKRLDVAAEIGDIGLMLIHIAARHLLSLDSCMKHKFETARLRTYKYDPELGYARHVEE